MPGGDRKNGKELGKVTPLNVYCDNGENRPEPAPGGGSLGELLDHMRRVRQAIPVNERLREELRARLTGMQADIGENQSPAASAAAGEGGTVSLFAGDGRGRRPKYLWLFPAALLLVAVYWMWWSAAAPKTLEAGPTREISRFWLEDTPLDFACVPGGRGFLAVRGGSLHLLDQYGNQTGTVKPPGGQSYASPALSGAGDKLALVRRHEAGGEEIITAVMPSVPLEPGAAQLVETALARAEVLLKVEQGKSLSGLAWSPDGQTLACSLSGPGGENEIYLLAKGREPVSLGAGRHPAWAPDGSRLVVERIGGSGQPELWLTGPGGGEARLTEGERPAWSPRGYLAFIRVKTTERVLTYSPDGSPLFTVQQRQGEIRAINAGRKGDLLLKQPDGRMLLGDRLLLAPDTRPGGEELNWLRRLESEGVREPRALLLEPLSNFQDINFSPDGKTLLVARRDGGTVALVQVGLHERLTRWGDR
ncbi:MAG: hypothetical protein HPY89_08930 [Pelotomaculum sp.]|nr:hypothetical protein [Pelotomaculum sp.]